MVAFDLAGEEKGFPAEDHMAAFQFAKENFLREPCMREKPMAPNPSTKPSHQHTPNESDMATTLFTRADQFAKVYNKAGYCEALAQYVADRRITIEVCITSNLQTNPEIGSVENHAFQEDARAQALGHALHRQSPHVPHQRDQ